MWFRDTEAIASFAFLVSQMTSMKGSQTDSLYLVIHATHSMIKLNHSGQTERLQKPSLATFLLREVLTEVKQFVSIPSVQWSFSGVF